MPSTSPIERVLAAKIAANQSWAQTADRTARTAAGRAAFEQKFLDEAGGDPVAAENLRKAYFARLHLASLRGRRLAAEARANANLLDRRAAAAENELAGGDM